MTAEWAAMTPDERREANRRWMQERRTDPAYRKRERLQQRFYKIQRRVRTQTDGDLDVLIEDLTDTLTAALAERRARRAA